MQTGGGCGGIAAYQDKTEILVGFARRNAPSVCSAAKCNDVRYGGRGGRGVACDGHRAGAKQPDNVDIHNQIMPKKSKKQTNPNHPTRSAK